MKYIYIYTTETYRAKGWYKVGMAKEDPHTRVATQDRSSCPESLDMICYWAVDDHILDYTIHKLLNESGFTRIRPDREWYELSNNPVEDINVIMAGLGQGLVESYTIHSGIVYNIPYAHELWWAVGIDPESASTQLKLEL